MFSDVSRNGHTHTCILQDGGMAPELELVSTSDCGVKMNSNPELTSEPVNSYCLEKLQSTDSYSCIYSLLNLDKVQLIYIYI